MRENLLRVRMLAPPELWTSLSFFPPSSRPHFRGFRATAVSGGRKHPARPVVNGFLAPLPAGFRRRRWWGIVRRRRSFTAAGAMEMPLPPDGEAQPEFRERFSLPGIPSWSAPPSGVPGPRRERGAASRVRLRPLSRVPAFPARLWPLSGPVQRRPLRSPPQGTPARQTRSGAPGPPGLGGFR